MFDHLWAPKFRLTGVSHNYVGKTELTFRQLVEAAEVRDQIHRYAGLTNEQSTGKLAARLKTMA